MQLKRKGWRCSALPKHLNDQADKLAKKSLIYAITGGHMMAGDFPFELVKLKLSGRLVCGLPWRVLEYDWGCCSAQTLFLEKDIVCKEVFFLIW
jgi:hypothetical protein